MSRSIAGARGGEACVSAERVRSVLGAAMPRCCCQASDKPKIVFVIGSTGTGKTALGVDIALRFNGEVVNADALQMYRGLDIATAKVTPEEGVCCRVCG